MLNKLHKRLFFITILSLPINLSKHYVYKYSYVDGILIDYLIPTLYITDILIGALLLVWLLENLISKKYTNSKSLYSIKLSTLLSVLLLTFIVLHVFINPYPSSIYKMCKIILFSFFSLYIIKTFSWEKDFSIMTFYASLSIIFQCVLSLIQWIKRGSVFNNFLYFGEFPYTVATKGIAFDSFFGSMVLPPYGTFAHPNVLSGFLVVYLTVVIFYSLREGFTLLNSFALNLGVFCLFLSLSLTAWFTLILTILFWVLFYFFKSKIYIVVFLILLFLNLLNLPFYDLSFFDDTPSVSRRMDLVTISVNMIEKNLWDGVGLNMFLNNMNSYGKVSGIQRFWQPVHNIFLYVFSELGIWGFLLFIVFATYLFWFLILMRDKNYFNILSLSLLSEIFILGAFDHYFLTIQQGMLLFWLTLGLVLNTINPHDKKVAHLQS